MKKVVAVAPYNRKEGLGFNFKLRVYNRWKELGGLTSKGHYPPRFLHKFAYTTQIPALIKSSKEARLRFVEANSITFDTFSDYFRYEIIPFVWDCWPIYFEKTCEWFDKYNVQTAIFTSSQTADLMRERRPQMKILTITEGIDQSLYDKGSELIDRKYNLIEIGAKCRNFFSRLQPEEYVKLCNKPRENKLMSNEVFLETLQESKTTVILPKCKTEPFIAGNIETLTQRYWECMLSRIVMVGICPKELEDLIGYNPVITLDETNASEQMWDILNHIQEYQGLVNKNREVALKYSSWDIRIKQIFEFLSNCGYSLK